MYVARHKETGLYLKTVRDFPSNKRQVPLGEARVYRSEQGARASITYGVPSNAHLLEAWEILPLSVELAKEN